MLKINQHIEWAKRFYLRRFFLSSTLWETLQHLWSSSHSPVSRTWPLNQSWRSYDRTNEGRWRKIPVIQVKEDIEKHNKKDCQNWNNNVEHTRPNLQAHRRIYLTKWNFIRDFSLVQVPKKGIQICNTRQSLSSLIHIEMIMYSCNMVWTIFLLIVTIKND